MIDLEKLKPILSGLNVDADTIDAIVALDVEPEDGSASQTRVTELETELQSAKDELVTLNTSWQERYKAAFFDGVVEDMGDKKDPEKDEQEKIVEGDIFSPYVEKED